MLTALQRSFGWRFLRGLGCILRAVGMLFRSPRILLLSALPFALSMIIYIGVFGSTIIFADDLAGLIVEPGPWWRDILWWMLVITVPLAIFVLSVFTFALLCFVIAAPLYELLSAAVERGVTGDVREEPFSVRAMLADVGHALADTVRILLIEIGVMVGALVFPPFTTALAAMVSGVLLALEYCDYPMGRRRVRFRGKLAFARRHFWEMLGLGLPMLFLLAVPFVGVAFLPLGVVAGTLLYVDLCGEPGG